MRLLLVAATADLVWTARVVDGDTLVVQDVSKASTRPSMGRPALAGREVACVPKGYGRVRACPKASNPLTSNPQVSYLERYLWGGV